MAEMTSRESFERFKEGLGKSISRCRELAKASGERAYNQCAFQLEKILAEGVKEYNSKQMADAEVNRLLNQIQAEIKN